MFVTEVKSWELRIQRIFTQQDQSPSLVLMHEFKITVEMLRFPLKASRVIELRRSLSYNYIHYQQE